MLFTDRYRRSTKDKVDDFINLILLVTLVLPDFAFLSVKIRPAQRVGGGLEPLIFCRSDPAGRSP